MREGGGEGWWREKVKGLERIRIRAKGLREGRRDRRRRKERIIVVR